MKDRSFLLFMGIISGLLSHILFPYQPTKNIFASYNSILLNPAGIPYLQSHPSLTQQHNLNTVICEFDNDLVQSNINNITRLLDLSDGKRVIIILPVFEQVRMYAQQIHEGHDVHFIYAPNTREELGKWNSTEIQDRTNLTLRVDKGLYKEVREAEMEIVRHFAEVGRDGGKILMERVCPARFPTEEDLKQSGLDVEVYISVPKHVLPSQIEYNVSEKKKEKDNVTSTMEDGPSLADAKPPKSSTLPNSSERSTQQPNSSIKLESGIPILNEIPPILTPQIQKTEDKKEVQIVKPVEQTVVVPPEKKDSEETVKPAQPLVVENPEQTVKNQEISNSQKIINQTENKEPAQAEKSEPKAEEVKTVESIQEPINTTEEKNSTQTKVEVNTQEKPIEGTQPQEEVHEEEEKVVEPEEVVEPIIQEPKENIRQNTTNETEVQNQSTKETPLQEQVQEDEQPEEQIEQNTEIINVDEQKINQQEENKNISSTNISNETNQQSKSEEKEESSTISNETVENITIQTQVKEEPPEVEENNVSEESNSIINDIKQEQLNEQIPVQDTKEEVIEDSQVVPEEKEEVIESKADQSNQTTNSTIAQQIMEATVPKQAPTDTTL